MSVRHVLSQGVIGGLPREPLLYDLQESLQRQEAAQHRRFGIDQLTMTQPQPLIQHEAKNQHDLATPGKLVLLVQRRHGPAFDDLQHASTSCPRTSYQTSLRCG
jgi:hypothetical protein